MPARASANSSNSSCSTPKCNQSYNTATPDHTGKRSNLLFNVCWFWRVLDLTEQNNSHNDTIDSSCLAEDDADQILAADSRCLDGCSHDAGASSEDTPRSANDRKCECKCYAHVSPAKGTHVSEHFAPSLIALLRGAQHICRASTWHAASCSLLVVSAAQWRSRVRRERERVQAFSALSCRLCVLCRLDACNSVKT
eukprot:5616-Heterococcus_DN1.PRE.3